MSWDVFLSHSSTDKDVVRQLREALRVEGVDVWFDEEQITLGDSIPLKIEDGLENSKIAVLCLSESFLQSSWTPAERAVYMYEDPSNAIPLILPVVISPCDLPRTLRHLRTVTYLPGRREAVDAIIDALTRSKVKKRKRPRKPLKRKLKPTDNIDYIDPENSDTTQSFYGKDPNAVVRTTRHTIALLDHAFGSDRTGLIVLDLDGFSNINRKFGRVGADLVLETIDSSVQGWCKTEIEEGRLESVAAWRGMDEWFIYIGHGKQANKSWLAEKARSVTDRVSEMNLSNLSPNLYVTACSGFALKRGSDETAIHLLRRSLLGLREGKRQGPRSVVCGPEMVAMAADDRAELELAASDVSSFEWYMRVNMTGFAYDAVRRPSAVYGLIREPKYLTNPHKSVPMATGPGNA